VHIVIAHEEPHPVGVPHNLAPSKLAIVTAEAHRSVDPLWHVNIVLPLREEVQVQLKTCKTRLEQSEAKNNTTEIGINYYKNRTITSKIIQIEVQLLQYSTMHKFIQ
jgi:hypothetical protein